MSLIVNEKAFAFIKQLIEEGKINLEGDWSSNQPNAKVENGYLENHDHEAYGNWFLAMNPGASPQTKARYEFPVGNFKEVFRSGLIAAKQRAGQYHHEAIEAAAGELLELLS